jgi:predicted RNase H-like nuclease (RuvC/YqgF family)
MVACVIAGAVNQDFRTIRIKQRERVKDMRIKNFEKRIMEIQSSLLRVNEYIKELDRDIEKARVIVIGVTEKYNKIEAEVLTAKDTDKYKLSIMYQNYLDWQIELTEVGNDFDELNRQHIEKMIRKLQYEHELQTLKEITEGSGGK